MRAFSSIADALSKEEKGELSAAESDKSVCFLRKYLVMNRVYSIMFVINYYEHAF